MDRQVYARMAAHEDRHWWFAARRRILSALLGRFVALPDSARLLEVGCGTGGNLEMLSRFGAVSAVEPDAEARRLAGAKGAFDIREGSLPDGLSFEESGFDLVAALDVIEHVEEDAASLKTLWRHLRPGGWLLLTVPAFGFLWSEHDVLHHHKRRYTKGALLALAEQAGFAPVRVSYFNSFLFPLVAAVRLARNFVGRKGATDDAMPPAVINRALATLFAAERHLLQRMTLPFGSSLLLLARRPAT